MTCARCGIDTPRLTPIQRYCAQCAREVSELLRRDEERRRPRFDRAKDLTGSFR